MISSSFVRMTNQQAAEAAVASGIPMKETITDIVRRMIRVALQKTDGNRSEAAILLGKHRNTVLRKIQALEIDAPSCKRRARPLGKVKA